MVIFIDENIPHLKNAMKHIAEIYTFNGRLLNNQELIEKQCNVLFVRSTTKVNSELLKFTNIKFVGTATSGIDHIDLNFLKQENIKFAFAPGSNSNSVAEYVIYSILKWHFEKNIDLKNKTIGIIGYGNIGKKVAYYSKIIGLNIIINDPPLLENNYKFPDYVTHKDLNELIYSSDIITNHVPLTKTGKHPTFLLLNHNNLTLIKDNSLLIHTSRGSVIDELALLGVIENHELTVCIDVWENEPLFNRLIAHKSMLATPHIAGYSRNGKLNGAMMLMKAFAKTYELQPDYSLINEEYKKLETDKDYILEDDKHNYSYDLKKLYLALKRNRDFEYDTALLKEIINLDEKQRGKKFDFLRKNYPIRKETLIYDEEII